MGDESPADPMSSMEEGAVQLHELYSSYRSAGFDRDQAMELISKVLVFLMGNQLEGM